MACDNGIGHPLLLQLHCPLPNSRACASPSPSSTQAHLLHPLPDSHRSPHPHAHPLQTAPTCTPSPTARSCSSPSRLLRRTGFLAPHTTAFRYTPGKYGLRVPSPSPSIYPSSHPLPRTAAYAHRTQARPLPLPQTPILFPPHTHAASRARPPNKHAESKMEIEKKQSKKICTIHAICVGEARVHTSSGVQPGSAMKGVSKGRVTMERMRERGKREEEEEKTGCARSEVKDDEQGIRNEFERMSGVAGDGRQQGAGDGTEGGGATARTREVEDAKRGRKEGWIELSGNTREGDAKKLAHTIGELAEGVKEAVRVGAVAVPLEEVGFVNGLRTKEVSLERNERKGDLLYAAAAAVPEADAAAVPRGAWPGARYTVISALEKNVVNDKEERKRMGFEEERRRGRYRPSRSKPPHTPPISHQYIRVHAPPTNLDLIASRASSFDEGPACGHLCIYPADGLWTDAMGDTLPTYIRLWDLRYMGTFAIIPGFRGGRGAMHYQHTYTIGLSQIRSTSKVAT
ncbi:hypothetical protein B0H11DRAFT_1945833 [Mycena galericulata]|nr:hypothetical protein B0H11DRAFT_1945833 [Mycena galericulata]